MQVAAEKTSKSNGHCMLKTTNSRCRMLVNLRDITGLDQLISIILLPPDYPGLSSSKSKQNIEIVWRDINKITKS